MRNCFKLAFSTIVVPVQTLESQPQLLLVILQILGELAEVQTPILVLVSRGHDFLQELKRLHLTDCWTLPVLETVTLTHVGDIPSCRVTKPCRSQQDSHDN